MNANGANQCVDDAAGGTGVAGTVVDITTCDGAPEQSWTHNSNGTLTTLGLCLDIDGDGTAPGTKVELWTCNGVGGQVWQQYPNGSLYNPQSGLCLDDPSGSTANGTGLQIWNCLGNQAQNYAFGY
jgi:hypothetical protein